MTGESAGGASTPPPDVIARYRVPVRYYGLKLEHNLRETAGDVRPNRVFAGVSDDFWIWANTAGYREHAALRDMLPALPGEQVQLTTNGISGDLALQDGFLVYRLVRTIYEGLGRELEPATVLDFGCGWGRVLRFFLKDVDGDRLWGIDHHPQMIQLARETNRWAHFERNESLPPSPLPESAFDLVYAYSVFSHLSEDAHRRWLEEFARILKPGGVAIATTWDRELIERCRELREEPDMPFFQTHLPQMFRDTDASLAAYDAGEFLFDTSVEVYGDHGILGEACIPEGYVRQRWSDHFAFVDFIADRDVSPQNVIVVRKG